MDAVQLSTTAISIAIVIIVSVGLRVLERVWLKPKKLEKYLRELGFRGNPYRSLFGDLREHEAMLKEKKSKQIKLSDNASLHAMPYIIHIINKFGKNSYMWWGQYPRVFIHDPELIKEIMAKPCVFRKPYLHPIINFIARGIVATEGEQWTKHRRLINPAFHQEKLKKMLPAMHLSCSEMINKWKMLVLTAGSSAEVDVWPYLRDLSGDVISRTAFGSNFDEGRRIFFLLKEQVVLVVGLIKYSFIPGYRYIPTKTNRRMKQVSDEIKALLRGVITKREKEMETVEVNNDDLLGILLKTNSKEIREQGIGLSIQEVMEECKLFYFAGSETTANLLVWTMVLLSVHSEWQIRAREEIEKVFGGKTPDFDGLNHLKIVSMVLFEVLRLYPPVSMVHRCIFEDTKLGETNFPAGMEFTVPTILIHCDSELWGSDAQLFRPERFSDGILSASKGKFSYIPFGGGPRICIAQNFAIIEAKMVLSVILQSFSFELSPCYKHAPFLNNSLQPQYGAPMILHRL